MSDLERASAHYADQLKAVLFAEVVQALRDLVVADCDADEYDAIVAARAVLDKIDSNELLK